MNTRESAILSRPHLAAPTGRTPRRRAALWSAILIFCTAAYFQPMGIGWNIASRFDLTLALAEHGTVRIDAYHDQGSLNTNDKAFFDGHFYSDKSLVTAAVAVPVVWATKFAQRMVG